MHSRFRTRPFLISFLCTALALLFLVAYSSSTPRAAA